MSIEANDDKPIVLTTNGAERMRVNATGVGIGVTAPASMLHVGGTVQVGVDDTGHDVKFFGATSGAYMLWDESADDLKLVGAAGLTVAGNSVLASVDVTGLATAATFEPDGDTAAGDNAAIGYTAAEGLILTGQGSTSDITFKNDADTTVMSIPTGTANVGIGTTAPATLLEIAAPASTATVLRLASNKTGSGAGDKCRWDNYSANNSGVAYQLGFIDFDRADATATASYMAIQTRVGSTVAERMRIASSGNVGIGTTAPASLLHLSANQPELTLSWASNYSGQILFKEGTTLTGAITMHSPTDTVNDVLTGDQQDGNMVLGTGASGAAGEALVLVTNGVQRMIFEGAGAVGIGVANPTAAFEVGGAQILLTQAGNTVLGTTNTTGTVSGSVQALSNQSVRVGSTTSYPTEIVANNAVKLAVTVAGTVNPGADNAQAFGAAGTRWTALYAVNGTIQTSDAREKTAVRSFSDAEITAAKLISKEIGIFQWLTAVDLKGADAARLHTGLTVQKAVEIMTAQGLDPMAYGFICYDEWEDEFIHHPARAAVEEVVVDGVITVEAVEAQTEKPSVQTKTAGNRYSFRYDQLNLFIARGVEARLAALEA
tara:strand:+ start:69 stop:1877 length:1809 start_codon:yes stop_codon:yes gene_type:complete